MRMEILDPVRVENAMAYVGLFLAVRSGDWELRVASMKLMAPVITAFGHQTYQKLISQHIADMFCMPPSILVMSSKVVL